MTPSARRPAKRPARPADAGAAAQEMVPPAGVEPALLAELDFESSASTNSATGATLRRVLAEPGAARNGEAEGPRRGWSQKVLRLLGNPA